MKAIRRSLKGDKERESRHQPQNSIQHKSATAIVPPKKVIKALYDYEPTNKNGQELAFKKGDFFHVVSREDDSDWYEACNPIIPSARGLVPVAFFEIINKQQRQSSNSVNNEAHDSGFSETGTTPTTSSMPLHNRTESTNVPRSAMHSRGVSMRSNPMVYGVVLYDFHAERPDELDAKTGEPIIVVAQSNPEWFVAKPIGRLGGPGLIPVTFVDIKDSVTGLSATDPLEAVRVAGVPRVEEWKRTAAEYKNSSISLGQINSAPTPVSTISSGMDRMSIQHRPQQTQPHPSLQNSLPTPPSASSQTQQQWPLAPISASVPRYCFDNDMYWYIIEAEMEDGRWWELSRYYADFYDFQIALLEAFPEEAGNRGKARTLPFMPGPVAHVTDAISNGRRQNLDDYIKQIVGQPAHISKSILVRNLFKPKPGQDYEIDPNALNDDFRLSGHSLHPVTTNGSQPNQAAASAFGGMPPPALPHPAHRAQPSIGAGGVSAVSAVSAVAPTTPLSAVNGNSAIPALRTQESTLTQGSTGTSGSARGGAPPSSGALRVKIHHENETVAVRVPPDITFIALQEKILTRLNVSTISGIQYKDEISGNLQTLSNDADLETAVQRNQGLRLFVS